MDKPQTSVGFSFIGLAEIVKEFRELIKDIRYRNRHEERVCELEIAERACLLRKDLLTLISKNVGNISISDTSPKSVSETIEK